MKTIKIFFIGVLLSNNIWAGCCTCSQQYSDLTSSLLKLAGSVAAATMAQKKETEQLEDVKKRGMLMLGYDKQRAEATAIAKGVDSAGFAETVTRFKADRVGTEANIGEIMRNGYDLADKDAEDITSKAR